MVQQKMKKMRKKQKKMKKKMKKRQKQRSADQAGRPGPECVACHKRGGERARQAESQYPAQS